MIAKSPEMIKTQPYIDESGDVTSIGQVSCDQSKKNRGAAREGSFTWQDLNKGLRLGHFKALKQKNSNFEES